ncbi:MAG: hypothetical protein AAFX93_04820 [Verrucomicrobiota bacterium]
MSSSQPAQPVLPEQILKQLCDPFAREADSLLDLYAMTQSPAAPSQCVKCFFRLLKSASPRNRQVLQPLRSWIESNIVISVRSGDELADNFPLQLDQPDLQGLCEQAMDRVRYDTVFDGNVVQLTFSYKSQTMTAA